MRRGTIVLLSAVAIGMAVLAIRAVTGTPPMAGAVAASNTILPHEIHLNYVGMKELPVRETWEPF
jgi:hypothetical protein